MKGDRIGWQATIALECAEITVRYEHGGALTEAAHAEGRAYGRLFRALELAYDKGVLDGARHALRPLKERHNESN